MTSFKVSEQNCGQSTAPSVSCAKEPETVQIYTSARTCNLYGKYKSAELLTCTNHTPGSSSCQSTGLKWDQLDQVVISASRILK